MNNADYNNNGQFHMYWSIYNQASCDAYWFGMGETIQELRDNGRSDDEIEEILRADASLAWDDIELDLSAPEGMPDGVYPCLLYTSPSPRDS